MTRLQIRTIIAAVVVAAAATTSIAAGVTYPFGSAHFSTARIDSLLMQPCAMEGGIKGSTMTLDETQRLVVLFTCSNDKLVLATDVRPVLDNPTAAPIHLYLDNEGSGWAFECGHSIESVSMLADGKVIQNFGGSFQRWDRPDVVALFGDCGQANSGIAMPTKLDGLTPGPHVITMRVVDEQGRYADSNPLQLVR